MLNPENIARFAEPTIEDAEVEMEYGYHVVVDADCEGWIEETVSEDELDDFLLELPELAKQDGVTITEIHVEEVCWEVW